MSHPFTIDIHTHILPKNWPDLKERYGYGGFIRLEHHKPCCANMHMDDKFFREVEANCWDAEVRMKEGLVAGCQVQVLSTVPVMFSYWARPEDTYDLSRILNDHIAGICRDFPTRFVGLGTLPMQAPDLAIKELERCMNELGMAGVEIGTHINDWNLDAPEVFAVLEAAQDLGAAVFVHPWDMMGKAKMEKYWLPWLVGMPAESSLAISSMIFSGIFDKLPNLRVAFAHGGGSFPATIGRIEHGWRVRPDLCQQDMCRNPREYLGDFWLDSIVHDPRVLDYVIDLVGEDKVALGTDYPFPLGEWFPGEGWQPGKLIKSMPYTHDTKAKLLAENALNWLQLEKSRFL
ncbi:MAG TPA: amidohydrolase [Bacteroidetes bacterium]|nr:amidohydrolase [Bacteroidota bacterium]